MTTGRINQVTLVKRTDRRKAGKDPTFLSAHQFFFITAELGSEAELRIRKSSLLSRSNTQKWDACIAAIFPFRCGANYTLRPRLFALHPIASLFFSCTQALKTSSFQSRRARWKFQLNRSHRSKETSGYWNKGYSRLRLVNDSTARSNTH